MAIRSHLVSTLLLSTLLAFTVVVMVCAPRWSGFYDLRCYHQAWQQLAAGESPWNPALNRAGLHVPFAPPPVLGLLAPIGLVSLSIAKVGYLVILIGLVIFYGRQNYMLLRSAKLNCLDLLPLFVLTSLPFGALVSLLPWGGMSLPVLLGLSLFSLLWKTHRDYASGLCLSLCLIKPHLLSIPMLLIVLRCVKEHRLAPLWGLGTGLLLGTVAIASCRPTIFRDWLDFIGHQPFSSILTAALPDVVSEFLVSPYRLELSIFFLGVLGIIFGRLFWRTSSPALEDDLISLSIPFSLLFAPYSWGHDFFLTCPTFVVFQRYFIARASSSAPRLFLPCVLLLLANITTTISAAIHFDIDSWVFIVPNSTITAVALYVVSRIRRETCAQPPAFETARSSS